VNQRTRPNPEARVRHSAEEYHPRSGAWGFVTGALIALLLVLAVWFGLGVHNSTTTVDVDVPGAPTEELEPSD
jgi:hypothetical protein